MKKYKNIKTNKIFDISCEEYTQPVKKVKIYFVYDNGELVDTVADWAFEYEYKEIEQ